MAASSRPLSLNLRHWRGVLLDCLPPAWRERLGSRVTPYLLELDSDTARLLRDGGLLDEIRLDDKVLDPTSAALLSPHECPLVLMVPPEWVLNRRISLPAAARENLRQVIGFELDRLTPFSADQVYFDFRVDSRGAGEMLAVDVAVLPRKKVDDWLALLRSGRIRVDKLSTTGLWPELNLLPAELRARPDIRRIAARALPVTLVILLLIAALALPLWQKRKVAIEMEGREAQLRNKANAVLSLRQRLDKKMEELEKVREQWQAAPPVLDVLHVLTNLLPDHTSLQQMEVKGDQLTIRGLSGQASSLIGLLEQSPAFDDPHFLSPVTQQRGKELFYLATTIEVPFPPVSLEAAQAPAAEGESSAEPAASAAQKQIPPDAAAARTPGAVADAPPPPAAVPKSSTTGSPTETPAPAAPVSLPESKVTHPITTLTGSPPPQRIVSGSGR